MENSPHNENKSVRDDFSLRQYGYIPSIIDGKPVSLANSARYLGLHLDCRLNWAEHIRQKCNDLNLISRKYYWMIGHRSTLSLQNKKLIYASILKPVWMYGIGMWGITKPSNCLVIQRFQNKCLRIITQASWHVRNDQLHADLNVDTVQASATARYTAMLHLHSTIEAIQLLHPLRQWNRLNHRYPLDS
jgi:hypothetical protein